MSDLRTISFIYTDPDKKRLDLFLSETTNLTRSFLRTIIKSGQIKVNQKTQTKAGFFLEEGNRITGSFHPPDISSQSLEPEEVALNIIHEDEHLLVIDKPAGMVVHPTPQLRHGTLVNALLSRYQRLSDFSGEDFRPGIVHRLDKDTSGLMLVAKTNLAHQSLSRQLAERTLKRVYWAVVAGHMSHDQGSVIAAIGRHPKDRKKMAVLMGESPKARKAITHWRVLQTLGKNTLLELRLETGRTHQIRVHMAHIGHPILADSVYGRKATSSDRIQRQCLHAKEISYEDPSDGSIKSFCTELPPDFANLLISL